MNFIYFFKRRLNRAGKRGKAMKRKARFRNVQNSFDYLEFESQTKNKKGAHRGAVAVPSDKARSALYFSIGYKTGSREKTRHLLRVHIGVSVCRLCGFDFGDTIELGTNIEHSMIQLKLTNILSDGYALSGNRSKGSNTKIISYPIKHFEKDKLMMTLVSLIPKLPNQIYVDMDPIIDTENHAIITKIELD